ncbi:MAG: DUF3037 domain-containing protein [Mycobacteriales bacterium]|nr:DUF3037 domain-containing protein [Mycobacteriales bacterium]
MSRSVFQYVLLRAVPRIDRGECVNIGVVLYSQQRDFLDCVVEVDAGRLAALDASVDPDAVRRAAGAFQACCRGEGPSSELSLGQRFGWLTAPRSTVVQAGPVHPGLTDDPGAELARLVDRLVR